MLLGPLYRIHLMKPINYFIISRLTLLNLVHCKRLRKIEGLAFIKKIFFPKKVISNNSWHPLKTLRHFPTQKIMTWRKVEHLATLEVATKHLATMKMQWSAMNIIWNNLSGLKAFGIRIGLTGSWAWLTRVWEIFSKLW